MKRKYFNGFITPLFILGLASYGTCEPVNYSETTDGDIKGLICSPFNFEIGINIIQGRLSYAGHTGGDNDSFYFNIGNGIVFIGQNKGH